MKAIAAVDVKAHLLSPLVKNVLRCDDERPRVRRGSTMAHEIPWAGNGTGWSRLHCALVHL